MIALRRALAAPVFALAFVFQLLTAGFTWAAQAMAGDDGKSRSPKLPLILLIAVLLAALTGWISLLPERPINIPTLADVGNDEQVSSYACIFAENSVRRHIEPQKVGFASCEARDKFKTVISSTEVSVSGIASIVGGKTLPFTVTMQRSVPGTGKYGFVLLRIEI